MYVDIVRCAQCVAGLHGDKTEETRRLRHFPRQAGPSTLREIRPRAACTPLGARSRASTCMHTHAPDKQQPPGSTARNATPRTPGNSPYRGRRGAPRSHDEAWGCVSLGASSLRCRPHGGGFCSGMLAATAGHKCCAVLSPIPPVLEPPPFPPLSANHLPAGGIPAAANNGLLLLCLR